MRISAFHNLEGNTYKNTRFEYGFQNILLNRDVAPTKLNFRLCKATHSTGFWLNSESRILFTRMTVERLCYRTCSCGSFSSSLILLGMCRYSSKPMTHSRWKANWPVEKTKYIEISDILATHDISAQAVVMNQRRQTVTLTDFVRYSSQLEGFSLT